MPRIPREQSLDALALNGDPYRFIGNRGSPYPIGPVRDRLILRKSDLSVRRQLFYEPDRFVRLGAMAGAS